MFIDVRELGLYIMSGRMPGSKIVSRGGGGWIIYVGISDPCSQIMSM